MTWSGGTYTKPRNHSTDDTAGRDILSADLEENAADFEAGINACLNASGQNPALGNLPMGDFKHTNVGAATSATDYLRADQLITQNLNFGSASGTSAINVSVAVAVSVYTDGMQVRFRAASDCSAGATFAINGLSAKALQSPHGSAVLDGDVRGGQQYTAAFHQSASSFVLRDPVAAGTTREGLLRLATSAQVLAGSATASGFALALTPENLAIQTSTFTDTAEGFQGTVSTSARFSRVGQLVGVTFQNMEGTCSGSSIQLMDNLSLQFSPTNIITPIAYSSANVGKTGYLRITSTNVDLLNSNASVNGFSSGVVYTIGTSAEAGGLRATTFYSF